MPRNQGHTIMELMIGTIVFVLFLGAIFATLDVGLKSWQIGEVRSDLQQSGEVAMKRLVGELLHSNAVSVQTGPDNEFIVFETAVSPDDAEFKRDIMDLGAPEWQAYVAYYAVEDPDNTSSLILYRNYKKRDLPGTTTRKLTQYEIDSELCNPVLSTNKVLARNLEEVKFEKSGKIITITFVYKKHIRSNASVAFSPGGGSEKGTEHFEIKSSVEPKN